MTATENDLFSFGTLLKAFRKRRRLTQQQLAETVGVHRNAVVRWEQGDYLPESKAMVLELTRCLHLNDRESRQLLEASLTALAPHWLVPLQRNLFFTGRAEVLEALHTQLGTDQAIALTQSSALHGLGGVGKTQVALEYAYRYALEYSAVFWIGSETEEQIVFNLLHIADVLQLPERDEKDQQRVVAAVQRWLATHGQWLLIWDNVEDLALLNRFLPSARSGATLITTRRHILGTLARGLDLLPMEQEEGMLFLLRRAKVLAPDATSTQMHQLAAHVPAHYAAAEELVKVMGGLPLALDQAGAYLEVTQCGLPAYLELFRARRAALLQQRGEGTRGHPDSVSTTFALAIAATTQHHPAVWDFLRVCAFLQSDAIPEELFRQGGEHLGAALEAVCGDELEWNRIIAVTCSYSLLSRQPEEQTLSMHRLVQAVLLDTMTEIERKAWIRRVIKALDAVFPTVTYETWKQCERLLPHALACAASQPDQVEEQCLAEVLQKAADYLSHRAQPMQAEPLYERALHIREQVLGPDHPKVAETLHNLAAMLSMSGKYERAEALYQRARHIREQTLGPEHAEVAETLYGLAHLYYRQGQYEQTEPLYQQALRIWKQALGPEHAEVAKALNNLAILYYEQGMYEQAEPLYRQALHIWERALGSEHPYVAYSLNNLALLYWEQGKYEQGKLLGERALYIWEQTLGPEHPELAFPLLNLARLYVGQGKYEQAESLYQRALYVSEHAFGPEHPNVAAILNGLARLYVEQGKHEQAASLGQRAQRLWEQVMGPNHPDLADTLSTLAQIYVEQGKYEQGEALCQRSLDIQEQVLGPEHPNVAFSLNTLATLYREQGKYAEAELLFQRALSIREQHLGQHHPETAQTLQDLAIFWQKQGNLNEATSFAERSWKARSQSLGDAHPKTVATRTLYDQLLQEQAKKRT